MVRRRTWNDWVEHMCERIIGKYGRCHLVQPFPPPFLALLSSLSFVARFDDRIVMEASSSHHHRHQWTPNYICLSKYLINTSDGVLSWLGFTLAPVCVDRIYILHTAWNVFKAVDSIQNPNIVTANIKFNINTNVWAVALYVMLNHRRSTFIVSLLITSHSCVYVYLYIFIIKIVRAFTYEWVYELTKCRMNLSFT